MLICFRIHARTDLKMDMQVLKTVNIAIFKKLIHDFVIFGMSIVFVRHFTLSTYLTFLSLGGVRASPKSTHEVQVF